MCAPSSRRCTAVTQHRPALLGEPDRLGALDEGEQIVHGVGASLQRIRVDREARQDAVPSPRRGRCASRARCRSAFSISSRLGRRLDAVKPRFASARPTADVSVFSRQATRLISPSPSRSDAHPVAAGSVFRRAAIDERAEGDLAIDARVELGHDPAVRIALVEERDPVGHERVVREIVSPEIGLGHGASENRWAVLGDRFLRGERGPSPIFRNAPGEANIKPNKPRKQRAGCWRSAGFLATKYALPATHQFWSFPHGPSTLVLVGTTKGAFILSSDDAREEWTIDGPHFPGEAVYAMAFDQRAGRSRLLVGVHSNHWGATIRFSDDLGAEWTGPERQAIRFPESSGLSLAQVWQIVPGRAEEPDVVWAGVEPAALFRSDDGGESGRR